MRFIRYAIMGLMGMTLASLNAWFWTSWQFWVIVIGTVIYGAISNAEGYKAACGDYPWEDK